MVECSRQESQPTTVYSDVTPPAFARPFLLFFPFFSFLIEHPCRPSQMCYLKSRPFDLVCRSRASSGQGDSKGMQEQCERSVDS